MPGTGSTVLFLVSKWIYFLSFIFYILFYYWYTLFRKGTEASETLSKWQIGHEKRLKIKWTQQRASKNESQCWVMDVKPSNIWNCMKIRSSFTSSDRFVTFRNLIIASHRTDVHIYAQEGYIKFPSFSFHYLVLFPVLMKQLWVPFNRNGPRPTTCRQAGKFTGTDSLPTRDLNAQTRKSYPLDHSRLHTNEYEIRRNRLDRNFLYNIEISSK